MTSLPVLRNREFSQFQRVSLSGLFLKNYNSYEAEIFCEGRQGVIVLMVLFSMWWLQRRRSSPGPENRRKNFDKILKHLVS